jgi:hypothetical protein
MLQGKSGRSGSLWSRHRLEILVSHIAHKANYRTVKIDSLGSLLSRAGKCRAVKIDFENLFQFRARRLMLIALVIAMIQQPKHNMMESKDGTQSNTEYGSSCTDAELLSNFVAYGDRQSIEVLIHRYVPMVACVCRSTVVDASQAEDAFQARS